MTVIHISTDYPDAYTPDKTSAIKSLVSAASGSFDQFVYSLNRIDVSPARAFSALTRLRRPLGNIEELASGPDIACWTYGAPARGFWLKSSMLAIADEIADDIEKRGIRPTLIQGHKLSMEGIIAFHVAEKLNLPFALSLQGNSDRNILNVRRDLWGLYRRIFHGAAIVFSFAPWILEFLNKCLGAREKETIMLPCITAQDRIITPKKTGNRIISAFHLKNWRLKNLPALVRGAEYTGKRVNDFQLDIFGGGSEEDFAAARSWAASADGATVRLPGALPADLIQKEMNAAAGFAMLSHKESFGMVFVEALLAGCPVVYPENAAIDGYFDEHDFAIPAAAGNQSMINEAMLKLITDQERLKRNLQRWQRSGEASFFQKDQISIRYRSGLASAIGQGR